MIRRLVLRRFKRFDTVEFLLPGHVVLVGPNNTGKTTVLQAVAAWSLALGRWKLTFLHTRPASFLNNTKARTELLPPALAAAGLPGFPYTRYHEIAAVLRPDEIHPEVREKLDGIARAFRQ